MSAGFYNPVAGPDKYKFGWDDEPIDYQMIPLGQARSITVHVYRDEPGDVHVFVEDPGVAKIISVMKTSGADPVMTADGFNMEKESTVTIVVQALTAGRTFIKIEAVGSGQRVNSCWISVKPPYPLTYQLAVLSDAVFVPKPADRAARRAYIELACKGAEKIWKDAANIDLMRVGDILDANIPKAVGPTIFVDDANVVWDVANAAVQSNLMPANFYVFVTWNLSTRRNGDIWGVNILNLVMIEYGWFADAPFIAAHELGHAMGAPHPTSFLVPGIMDTLVMAPSGNQGGRVQARDIEICNRAR